MTHTRVLDTRTSSSEPPQHEGPVLVALKPFDGGDSAIKMGRWLAGRRQAELQAMSVIEMGDPGTMVAGLPRLPEELYQREREEVASNLLERVASPAVQTTPRVDVCEGPPGSTIAQAAAQRTASMIVIGTGRHDRLGRFLYGERALDVVRNAEGSVLVVPPDVEPPVRRAMVAVDFSIASVRAAKATLEMLDDDGRLTLVHVESAASVRNAQPQPLARQPEHRARSLMARFVEALGPSAVPVEIIILHGDPLAALLRHAEEQKFDLIACGRRRHSIVERLLVGSVSTGLIRGAPCTILVAPEQPDDSEADANILFGQMRPSADPEEWRELLHALSERNTGRRARLSLEAASPQGVESVDRGYLLLAVDYDRRGARADIILGDPNAVGSHLTHRITGIRRIQIGVDPDGRDSRLEFETKSGMCTLDFIGP